MPSRRISTTNALGQIAAPRRFLPAGATALRLDLDPISLPKVAAAATLGWRAQPLCGLSSTQLVRGSLSANVGDSIAPAYLKLRSENFLARRSPKMLKNLRPSRFPFLVSSVFIFALLATPILGQRRQTASGPPSSSSGDPL